MDKKEALTNREVEILKLIVDEYTSTQIAETLDISIRTVETHRKNISHKVNARSPIALMKYAIRYGYLEEYSYKDKK